MIIREIGGNMRQRYLELSDHLNLAQYPVILPVNYGPVSAYYEEFNVAPIYDPNTEWGNTHAKGVATISQMIDIFTSNQSIEIIDDDDVLEIDEILTAYLTKYVKAMESNSRLNFTVEQKQYIRSAESFLREIKKLSNRVHYKRGSTALESKSLDNLLGLLGR